MEIKKSSKCDNKNIQVENVRSMMEHYIKLRIYYAPKMSNICRLQSMAKKKHKKYKTGHE